MGQWHIYRDAFAVYLHVTFDQPLVVRAKEVLQLADNVGGDLTIFVQVLDFQFDFRFDCIAHAITKTSKEPAANVLVAGDGVRVTVKEL